MGSLLLTIMGVQGWKDEEDPTVILMPFLSAAISGYFAYLVTRQYMERGKEHQLIWGISLWLAAAGSLAYGVAVVAGSAFFFRIFYLSGAVFMVALLGVGSCYLAFGPRIGRISLLAVAALGLLVSGAVMGSSINNAALADLAVGVGSGRGVLRLTGLAAWGRTLLNLFGTLAVAGVAIKSAVDVRRRQAPRNFLNGNLLIAGGVVANAMAGAVARWGRGFDPFWLLMTLGWVLMFLGFAQIGKGLNPARSSSGLAVSRSSASS